MYLVFDIGGTKLRVGISKDGYDLDEFRVEPTPSDFEEGMTALLEITKELTKGEAVKLCAGGITGALDKERQSYLYSPHLPMWSGKPLKTKISEIAGCDVFLENDSAMVALGEATKGAGQGFRIVSYLTISTGIGGARIVDGKIDANVFGFEPGHQIIDADGTLFPDFSEDASKNSKGEFESLASGYAILKRFGKNPFELDDGKIWDHIHWVIAQGLCNVILLWSPEVVVFGGGIVDSGKLDLEKVKIHLNEVLRIFPETPILKRSELKDLGGLMGSLSFLRNRGM